MDIKKLHRLKVSFFNSHPANVAPKLLGKYLIVKDLKSLIITKIVEVEAYGGKEDFACHVARKGFSKKGSLLFGKIGTAYVYPVHINTYCLNIVCHKKNDAGGILIRALEPIEGIDIILKNLGKDKNNFDKKNLLNGPGKICRALKINTTLNGYDLVLGKKIYLAASKETLRKKDILATPRINIPYAGISKRWRWRFIIKNSEFLSKK